MSEPIDQTKQLAGQALVDSQASSGITAANDARLNQQEQKLPQTDLDKRQAFCGLEKLPEGTAEPSEQIGEGGFGTVFRGTLTVNTDNNNPIDIIVKQPQEGRDKELNKETEISSTIMNAAKENLQKDDNLVSSQEGFSNVVFQQKIDGKHVQKRINGNDGFHAIYDKQLYLYCTDTGCPTDITQALALAQQFLNGIHALHEQGIAHCDIKPENIMIEMTDNGPKLTIIDLGGAANHGSSTQFTSLNCAPEVLRELGTKRQFTASPQADIYAAGTVLCELLFGAYQYEYGCKPCGLWNNFFWMQANNHWKQSSYSICDDPELALRKNLNQANMLNGQPLYPSAIFDAIEDLIVKMCAIDHKKRPSSQYCLAVLNDLVLCDHEAIRNDKTDKIKPMVTGTLSQALQLIYDLNNLNQKKSLTPEEKATEKVLLYNLKRDFEMSNEDQNLNTQLKNAIKCVSAGEEIPEAALTPLIKKQQSILHDLQGKLANINTEQADQLKKEILEQLKTAANGNLLSQNDINNLRTAVTIEIQKDTLQNLKTQLNDINTDQAIELKKDIDAALQKLQGNEEQVITPILLPQSEIDKFTQATRLLNIKTKLDGINTDQANKLKEEIDAALQKLKGNKDQGIQPVMLTNFEINNIDREAQEAQEAQKAQKAQLQNINSQLAQLQGLKKTLKGKHRILHNIKVFFKSAWYTIYNFFNNTQLTTIDKDLNDAIELLEISQKNLKWLIEETKKRNDTSYSKKETIQALSEDEIENLTTLVKGYDSKRKNKK